MLVGGHGDSNPNSTWLNEKGLWLSYCIGVLMLHLVLLCLPFLSTATAWTLTNVIHNLVVLNFLILSSNFKLIIFFATVYASAIAYSERISFRAAGPRKSPLAHSLGANWLRKAVHRQQEISYNRSSHIVSSTFLSSKTLIIIVYYHIIDYN